MKIMTKKQPLSPDYIFAALRNEEKRLQSLLNAIEMNDASVEVMVCEIEQIEQGLRRIREAA